jgi:DNA-binding LacI/PurR family transcriptional regulator
MRSFSVIALDQPESAVRPRVENRIVPVGNLPCETVSPLTTVHHDFAWEGERAMEMLFHAINREPLEPTLQVQHPGLIIRESTAPPSS